MTHIKKPGIFDVIRAFLFGSSWTRTIVCLAVSRKYSGYCVAGREITGGKEPRRVSTHVGDPGCGEWVRPVSRSEFAELTPDIMRLKSGGAPNLLDIVEVPLMRPVPCAYQSENCLVDESRRWRITGAFPCEALSGICDEREILWLNGYSSAMGLNDRIPEKIAEEAMEASLSLIRPESLTLTVENDLAGKRKVRAQFVYHKETYRLVVTDPVIEAHYMRKMNGRYPIRKRDIYICVSLSEPYEGYVYKLAASIINAL